MSALTDELKADHAWVLEKLEEVKRKGIVSEDAVETLMSIKNALIGHLQKEDAKLYPVLNKAAESDNRLKNNLKIFAKDMEQITADAIAFFDRYSTTTSDSAFAEDIGALFSRLKRRISTEEKMLYSEYDKVS
ncbi:hypothetical protein BOW53_14330 [Solemya pervernicosa gill symbiont]|uniref:Hemerythrin-like domain-containing protein n=2 Tax=Gammaproteobacteria incertae sedis TaxID=118884 RepID=A0A1T2L180_9GAMM|nr:hemerythrin domain-containing protein [Candidatus Reidiella endopervernicosa]OOZ38770.1 hypothetical protein BOW53_14330 [Solemya pervernicosa gill symbiont]QKQ26360.1 hemerythrin domain-containing protein [Candidatus Reidiella endopervernicosa]